MSRLAKHLGVPILQASTRAVYGDLEISSKSEDDLGNVNLIGVRAVYDQEKQLVETLTFDYRRHFVIEIEIVGIFDEYGLSMQFDDGHELGHFIFQTPWGDDVKINCDGYRNRLLSNKSYIVDNIVRLLFSITDITGAIDSGNEKKDTVQSLAEKVVTLTNSNSKIVLLPMLLEASRQRMSDINHASQALDWSLKVCLEGGPILTIVDSRKGMLCSSQGYCGAIT